MKARDVMSAHPILAAPGHDGEREVGRLMSEARVRHVPVMDDGLVRGVWVEAPDGRLVLHGPERVGEVSADVDAAQAMRALMEQAEVVLVRDAGMPVGVITRSDALGIVRAALGQGIGRRHHRPLVVRVAGPAGGGKTTLIMRTLARLDAVDAVLLQANDPAGTAAVTGIEEIVDRSVHWRAGLVRAIDRLADAQLIVVEDRDGVPDLARGIGEDLRVAVLPAAEAAEIDAERLADAQAVVLTHVDELAPAEAREAARRLADRCPWVAVFRVAATREHDPGLDEWADWVARQVMRRRD
jgi:CBS domain-containing protein